ncbi:MAG: hypothetical protein Q8Q01_01155 [archaeon]|nr:hypothetical protein [archaeon]
MANLFHKITLVGILASGSACHEFEGWNEVYACNPEISEMVTNSYQLIRIYESDIENEIETEVPWPLQNLPPSEVLDFIESGRIRVECGSPNSENEDVAATWSNWREKVTLNAKHFQKIYERDYENNHQYINDDDVTFNFEEAEKTMLNHIGGVVGGYQEVDLASKEVYLALSKMVEVLTHEATHAAFYYNGWDNAHKAQNRQKDTFYQYGWRAGDAILNNPRQEVKEELKLMRKELIENPPK